MSQDQMANSAHIPTVGAPVCTRDGAELGTVKEVDGAFFKVDAPRAKDYWLSCEFVRMSSGERIEVDFDEKVLGDYKLDGPSAAMTASPILDAASETFDTPAEKGEQRDRMESGYGDSAGDIGTRR